MRPTRPSRTASSTAWPQAAAGAITTEPPPASLRPPTTGRNKMAIERRAHATWEGDLRSGSGRFDLTSSGAVTGQPVTFASRFEPGAGGKTSPEGLIAAAHAACVSVALSNGLAQDGHAPTRLETD